MPIAFPQSEDTPTYNGQAVLDGQDLLTIAAGSAKTGVVSGFGTTATGSTMVLTIASGVAFYLNQPVINAGGTLTPANGGTYDRIDAVTVTSAGALALVAGTPGTVAHWTYANGTAGISPPVIPYIPTTSILLYTVYVPASATTLSTGNLVDKRLILTANEAPVFNVQGYGAKVNGTVNRVGDGHITSGAAVFTSSSGTFTLADQGKTIAVSGAGVSGAPLYTTITTFNSATSVTLAANAGTTVTTATYLYGTDDTTAVNAALSAANAAGGGNVVVPAGICTVNALTTYNNVWFSGAGYGATTLMSIANNDLLITNNVYALEGTNSTGGVYNFAVRDMTFDGFVNSAGAGIRIYGYGYLLQNLRVRNFTGAQGIRTQWSTSAPSPGNDSMEAQIINVKSHSNYQGVLFQGPHDTEFVNLITYSNSADGIRTDTTASYNGGAAFVNCHSWGNSGYNWNLNAVAICANCITDGSNAYFGASGSLWTGGYCMSGASFTVGASINVTIRGVGGYNPVGSAVPGTAFALPASTVAWTNNTGVDGTLYTTAAGTVTAVTVNGVALSATLAIGDAYRVASGGTFKVTYSSAPTLKFVGD